MPEAIFCILVCIIILIIPACIHIRRQREVARQREEQNADLPAFRQQQQAQRRAGNNTPAAPTTTTTTTTQPSAPVEETTTTESRKELVMKHLYHRTLEHGESVRNLSMILAAANDRYDDTSKNNNVVSRSWRSAETSVNKFVGQKPECSICLDHYEAKETVCWAKNDDCDHIFHKDCIVQWLCSDHDDCPLCRTNLLEYNGDDEEVNV